MDSKEVSLWFVLIGFTIEPQVKPGVWHPKICAQLWLHCSCHRGVNDSAMHVTVVSMTPLNFYQNLHNFTAVSMTPLCTSQGCPWLRFACHSGLKDSAVQVTGVWMTPLCNKLFRFSRRILSHIEKGFNPCTRGIGGVVWWKKRCKKISFQGPFNSLYRAKK
jgi:hypothetical protein